MNPRQVNPVGWEVNSGDALVGFRPTMQSGYLRAKHRSVSEQQPQPRLHQLSSQLQRLRQRRDKPPPPHPPLTVTGPILAPRKSSWLPCLFFFGCINNIFTPIFQYTTRLVLYISSWPSNTASQSESEGWDAWPTSSSTSQNPSLNVPSAQLRQRSAFTPATMTTGSSPSPVLGQVARY